MRLQMIITKNHHFVLNSMGHLILPQIIWILSRSTCDWLSVFPSSIHDKLFFLISQQKHHCGCSKELSQLDGSFEHTKYVDQKYLIFCLIWASMRENLSLWVATTNRKTSLSICPVCSGPLLFTYWKVSYLILLQVKFQFSS